MFRTKPVLLIGNPCGGLHGAQESGRDFSDQELINRRNRHVEFCARLYDLQVEQGLYFVHEHTSNSSTWNMPAMKELIRRPEVQHRKARWSVSEKDSMSLMSNASALMQAHQATGKRGLYQLYQLDSTGEVQETQPGGVGQIYLKSMLMQLKTDGRIGSGIGSTCKYEEEQETYCAQLAQFWDDITGQELKTDLVRQARKEEMLEFQKHDVYTKVPIAECLGTTGKKPIGVRWVDVNKGDSSKPKYRSRLVAKELNLDKREDLFAATPPVEAKKLLLSLAMTEGYGFDRKGRWPSLKIDCIDVKRAFFHAKCLREVYVDLPEEDYAPGMCGKLNKAMYGTRDAPQNWEFEYCDFMESLGFSKGKSTPCLFYHEARNLRVVVYGDDFTILGLSLIHI